MGFKLLPIVIILISLCLILPSHVTEGERPGIGTSLGDSGASFHGEGSHDNTGTGIAGGCDLNGDGYDDLIINSQSRSVVYVIFGKDKGWNISTSNARKS